MIDATIFCYPARQVSAAYDDHICTKGIPTADTQYLARERENGTPNSGYRPAFYVPGKNRLIVIIDKCFTYEGHAKAWMADQIRLIAISRRNERMEQTCER